jgi:NifU-like protein involved in Fe-S cluster formation
MAGKDTKIVTIDEEQEQDTAIPAASAPVAEVVGSNHDDELCGDKVKIEIHEAEGDGGKEDVTVQINGYAYKIHRGEEVIVPVEVLHVLENATMTLYENKAGGGHAERRVKRYAYSVLGNLPKAQ